MFRHARGAAGAAGTAQGDTHKWDSEGGDNNFSTGANWDQGNTAPATTDNLTFGTGARTSPNNNLSSFSFNQIIFNSGSPAFTIGGNSFTLTGAIRNDDPDVQTLNTPIVLGGAGDRTIAPVSGDIVIGGVISGSHGLYLQDTKKLTLSGANTFTGLIHINGPILVAAHNTALGTTAGGVKVGGIYQLQLTGGITVGAEALELSGAGPTSGPFANLGALYNLSGDNTWQGTVTIENDATIGSASGSYLTFTAPNSITRGTMDRNLTIKGAGDVTVSGNLKCQSSGVTKGLVAGDTGKLTLSGVDTYSGATTVNAGRLLLNNASSTCGGSVITVNSGGYLGGSGFTGTGTVTVNAGGAAPGRAGRGRMIMKHTDDYSAKLEIWAEERRVHAMPRIANLPRFGHRRFSSHAEMNAWKQELLLRLAEEGGAQWTR